MIDLDELVPNYRRAQRRWPSAPSLTKHYASLASCYEGCSYGLIEHIKSFIESVCITIMGELREPIPSSTPSTTDLLVAALFPLGLRNTRGASKLDKVLSGFNRLTDTLAEMRNETGPVAHGKDGFLDAVAADHARAFLAVGDSILGVLLNALEGKEPDLNVTREPYESFPHLNERIDRAVRVEAWVDEDGERQIVVFSVAMGPLGEELELRIEPSRLLYGIDRGAYIEVLKTAELVIPEAEEEAKEPSLEAEPTEPAEVLLAASEGSPLVALVPRYSGPLDPYRVELRMILAAEALDSEMTDGDGNRLADSLFATMEQNIGLDWMERESIQARIKVSCKRVLVHFGVDTGTAAKIGDHLVAWLRQ